ncbi:MAG: hypothetical protein FIA95_12960 [Gemmatimonadetes bacterium]|nr:hypothetical protein [Gemmatimonadota bacterium]
MTLLLAVALSLTTSVAPASPLRWGSDGHQMASRAAAETLPTDMPAFFRSAGDQLAYLGPEPDRWRSRPLREMDQAWSYDHYIDLENVPAQALEAPDRWVYLRMLYQAGLERPEADAGFLPFRTIEMYQRLVTEWRLWRAETDPARKAFIEDRILNDAGTLGHYVADAANPHHTTIHFNGWAEGTPNPHGYTSSRDFHGRFESDFVRAHVTYADVSTRVQGTPRSVAGAARVAVWEHVAASNAQVETLYRLETEVGFDPAGATRAETRDFAAARIAAAAEMLRTLWWSAWLESATAP